MNARAFVAKPLEAGNVDSYYDNDTHPVDDIALSHPSIFDLFYWLETNFAVNLRSTGQTDRLTFHKIFSAFFRKFSSQ